MQRQEENVEREVAFRDGTAAWVDLARPVARHAGNPLLTADDVNRVWRAPERQVVTVHNAGVVRHEGATLMLFRSHLRCGISVLGLARSADGITGWDIAPRPALQPAVKSDRFAPGTDVEQLIANEAGGVEDPRIVRIGERYAITYSAYHGVEKDRVRVSLAVTDDFRSFTRHGPVDERDMRNVVIFPRPFAGRFAALLRPNDHRPGHVGGTFTQIRIAFADDWRAGRWEVEEQPVMETGKGPSAFLDKIGPGAPPIETSQGWLHIFHGVRSTMDGNPYVLGVALHDAADPRRVRMSGVPILLPSRADCRVAEDAYVHVPNVVFTCGAIARDDGAIEVYYGGNDTVMNLAITHRDVLLALCERLAHDPIDGRPLYCL